VPVPGPSTLQGRALSCRATRATQKVKEAKSTRSKSKGKGKAKINNTMMEEARMEKLKKLKAEIAVLQELVDQLES
jgi:nitrogen regulatory protein PII